MYESLKPKISAFLDKYGRYPGPSIALGKKLQTALTSTAGLALLQHVIEGEKPISKRVKERLDRILSSKRELDPADRNFLSELKSRDNLPPRFSVFLGPVGPPPAPRCAPKRAFVLIDVVSQARAITAQF